MADFETHPINTVNKLRQEILRLELMVQASYYAGFDAGMDQGVHWNDKHDAYKAFQQQNGDK